VGASNWAELGFPEIDQEHSALLRIIRELDAAVRNGDNEAILAMIERLSAYSAFHFRTEEHAMRVARYPALEAHAAEHRKFTAKIDVLKMQLYRTDLGTELLAIVTEWFRAHTTSFDESFARYLAGYRADSSPNSLAP
jgi:hemerythrin